MTLKNKFLNATKRGTGEAHLILQANPGLPLTDAILAACVQHTAYDPQGEGSRAVYLSELIELANCREEILPKLIEAVKNPESDTWSIEQLFDILAIFANSGDKSSMTAIRESYYSHAMNGADWLGRAAVVAIDGFEGLKFIAATTGEQLTKFPEKWEDSSFVDDYQEEYPTIDVYSELRNVAESDRFVKRYVEAIAENQRKHQTSPMRIYDYDWVKARFRASKTAYVGPGAAQKISSDDIERLARDFLVETSRTEQRKYLRLFAAVRFPFGYRPIFELARISEGKNNRLFEAAAEALKFFKADEIRDLALRGLSGARNPQLYLDLLSSNYRDEDSRLLAALAQRVRSVETVHTIAMSLIEIYEMNSTSSCREPLETVYRKLTCGLCRHNVVKIMLKNNVLSAECREEVRFDSDLETRALVSDLV